MKNIFNSTEINAATRGKTVVITGATGGLGIEVCKMLAQMGSRIITVDRNEQKAHNLHSLIKKDYPNCTIQGFIADLENIEAVKEVCCHLEKMPIDILIHNAGAYSIPRKKTLCGFENVFQINFVSPYYITKRLLPILQKRNGHAIVVGSIAHNYAKTDKSDIDFSRRTACNLIYGNSKRYLMFSHYGLFENQTDAKLSVVHPGITFTNITAHYPKWLFFIIKHPMKIIFMRPKKAALSIIEGIFSECKKNEWIGPKFFDVWGLPSKKHLHTVDEEEYKYICSVAEKIYGEIE